MPAAASARSTGSWLPSERSSGPECSRWPSRHDRSTRPHGRDGRAGMTAPPVLTLAFLVLAHLVADFVVQTERIATDKFTTGPRAWQALGAHVVGVAVCLVPALVPCGLPGLCVLVPAARPRCDIAL